jgi:hypothetical protein
VLDVVSREKKVFRSVAGWMFGQQRRPPGHDAGPPDGSHRRLARHRVALRRGRTSLGDGLRTGVSLEVGLTVRSFERPGASVTHPTRQNSWTDRLLRPSFVSRGVLPALQSEVH